MVSKYFGFLWVVLEDLPQFENEVVDRAIGGVDVVSPDGVEQLIATDDLAGAFDQIFDDHTFFASELVDDRSVPKPRTF